MTNEELRRYYEERFVMMSTKAWKDLIEDVERMLVATNTLEGVTPENVRFKQGEVSLMRWLLTLEQSSRDAYENIKEQL
jgi:hypothetical protein